MKSEKIKESQEIKAKMEAYLEANKITRIKSGRARNAKAPGLACSWNNINSKPGTAEQIAKREKSLKDWKERKARFRKMTPRQRRAFLKMEARKRERLRIQSLKKLGEKTEK